MTKKQTTPPITPTTELDESTCLSSIISNLSPAYKQILGEVSFRKEQSHHLLKAFNNGTLICGSGGSLVEESQLKKGTHSYSIQPFDNDMGRIEGDSFTHLSTTMSSLTVESYGVITNLICLTALNKVNQEKSGNPTIRLVTDNKEVIKRCKSPPEIINANQIMIPEYDLWTLIWELIPKIQAKLIFQWQPGHQDKLDSGEKVYGPYQRKAQINIENDRAAGKKM